MSLPEYRRSNGLAVQAVRVLHPGADLFSRNLRKADIIGHFLRTPIKPYKSTVFQMSAEADKAIQLRTAVRVFQAL